MAGRRDAMSVQAGRPPMHAHKLPAPCRMIMRVMTACCGYVRCTDIRRGHPGQVARGKDRAGRPEAASRLGDGLRPGMPWCSATPRHSWPMVRLIGEGISGVASAWAVSWLVRGFGALDTNARRRTCKGARIKHLAGEIDILEGTGAAVAISVRVECDRLRYRSHARGFAGRIEVECLKGVAKRVLRGADPGAVPGTRAGGRGLIDL